MPAFGEFETLGDPLVVTEERNHVATIWQARKTGGKEKRLYAIKCYAPRPKQVRPGQPEGTLDRDLALEFLEGVKQTRKAQSESDNHLAPIHAWGTSEAGAWYATDFYPRNNLRAWIAKRGGVNSSALRHIVGSVVAGCLALKKSRGYSHGNVKPSNIFLVGKPRPLRNTPLRLVDAYPASPLQIAGLETGDRREVGELLNQVIEAQDLRAIGELILQLVEGRLVLRSDEYDYPVDASPAWDKLGNVSKFWRDWCNRLLDPQLSLERVNLETVAAELRPSAIGAKVPLILGLIAMLCLLGAGAYFGISAFRRSLAERSAKRERDYAVAMQEGRGAYDRRDYLGANIKAEVALKIRKRDADATKLQSDAQAQLNEQKYVSAISSGKDAFERKDYASAIASADIALGIKSGDPAATQLKSDAKAKQDLVASAQEQERKYAAAISSGKDAFERKDYASAIASADIALGIKSGDPAATRLKSDAKAKQDLVASAREQERKYAAAISSGKDAFERKDYASAIASADIALGIKSGDPAATQLKSDAKAKQDLVASAQEQERKYAAAISSGKDAFERKDYASAIASADIALGIKSGDPAATRLKSDAKAKQDLVASAREQERKYAAAISSGKDAFERKDYASAIASADIALGIKSGDPAATQLKRDAKAKQDLVASAQEQERKYAAAIRSGKDAFERKDYASAIASADIALGIKSGDPAATRLKSDVKAKQDLVASAQEQERKYAAAISSGKDAFERKDYASAIASADIALGIKSGDPAATQLKRDAQAKRNLPITQGTSSAKQDEEALAKLDVKLDNLMRQFRVKWKGDNVLTKTGTASPLPNNDIDQTWLDARQRDVQKLREEYGKWLDQVRKNNLEALEKKIGAWNNH